jgi:hydrogenase nickel incorporation protein HypA/HybF
MHETDMTKALILTVRDWLAEQTSSSVDAATDRAATDRAATDQITVERVHLTVGAFTCVEPASLQFAFRAQTQGTFLGEAELVITETPLIAFCHACQREYRPDIGMQYACITCAAPMEDIRSGRELKIERVEFSQS